MAENLKTTKYRDGSEIPNITINGEWGFLSTGAYGDYGNNPANSETYGRLYNWYTVDDDRGVCPDGWHVPDDAEFTVLTDFLGGTSVAGGKMKEAGLEHWSSPNTGATNESGFTALPAGYRDVFHGGYVNKGTWAYFWANDGTSSAGAVRELSFSSPGVVHSVNATTYGHSIRCLADEITTGCTDPEACNYDETATADDGTCAYEYDCAGTCGGELEWDCAGICGGDNSTYDGCCGLPPNDDCTDDCVTDDLGQCCTPQDVDECGVCYGDDYSCTEFACVTDCPNFDDISGFLDNDCVVCDFLEDDAWNNVCSEDCGFDFWYLASNECDWGCNIWGNQDECQSYDCIWDDNSQECNNWPNYSECEEVYDEGYTTGLEEGILIGGQSGDANGDGTLDILDIVYFIDVILYP